MKFIYMSIYLFYSVPAVCILHLIFVWSQFGFENYFSLLFPLLLLFFVFAKKEKKEGEEK